MKRIARIFLWTFAVCTLGLLLLLGLSSYWLPWAAPRLLGLGDVAVDSATRGEEGELVLRGLRFSNSTVDLSLDEFRSPMPLPLAWYGLLRSPEKAGEILLVDLDVSIHESGESDDAPTPGPGEVLGDADGWLDLAERWLPPVSIEKLSLTPPGREEPFVVSSATFHSRELTVTTATFGEIPSATLTATFEDDGPWALQAGVDAWQFVFRADLAREADLPGVRGEFHRESGAGTFSAEWNESSWIPSKAWFGMSAFQIPAGIGGLPPEVGTIGIDSLALDWDGSSYSVESRISGGQAGEDLNLDLAFAGDLESVVLGAFEVKGSWLRLTLGEPVSVDLSTLMPEAPVRFSAYADLAGQDYYPAQGELRGTLEANVDPNGSYPVQYVLKGHDLQADGRVIESVELSGSFDYPELAVTSLRVDLPEGSVAQADGGANLEERSVKLRGTVHLEGKDLDALAGGPTGVEGSIDLEAEASGPWERPQHRGTVKVGAFTPPAVVPLALNLDWSGEGAEQLEVQLSADTGEESVQLSSAWIRDGSDLTGSLNQLEWAKATQPFLSLQNPVEIHLNLSEIARSPWKGLHLGALQLTGDGREIGLEWSPPERASLSANGLRSNEFAGWLSAKESIPDLSIESMLLSVADFEPVMIGEASLQGSWRPDSQSPPVTAMVQGQLGVDGVELTQISATFDQTSLLNGNLTLPITLNPWVYATEDRAASGEDTTAGKASAVASEDQDPFLRVLSGGELSGSLRGEWSAELREQIRKWGGPDLKDADINLELGGTVKDPKARLTLDVNTMNLGELGGEDIPAIRNLQIELLVDAEKILLRQGNLELRDSGLSLTAELPYPDLLREYQRDKKFDYEKLLGALSANAELRNWNAATWKDRLPILLRPQGKITGSIGVDPGLELRGELVVGGFGLRPTLSTPPVDDINATLRFEKHLVKLEKAGAMVGGGKVSASGVVNLEDWLDPRYTLTLTGENIPVVRTPDMILRTDADITVTYDLGETAPLIAGELNLRNSTYLIAFDPFSPNIESGPGTHPPYFSIKDEPFTNWRLDLTIEGQDFLRVRSSIFTTELSAGLRLTRTLGNPLLLGSIRANGGRIRFPGMSMRIESAEAYITPENPNLLQIEADAIGQNRTYVVTMNASGSTEDPQIQFTSTPTLSNAQIIRLLATGSLDGGGAGAIGLYIGQALLGPGNGEETLADRLSVEIGQEVTENGRSTVDVIYRLNDRWSIEGEYDRYDTYNLNLIRILLER